METINETNLSISELQDVNELNAEELDAVAGGWMAFAAAIVPIIVDHGLKQLFGGSDEPAGDHHVGDITGNDGSVTINNGDVG